MHQTFRATSVGLAEVERARTFAMNSLPRSAIRDGVIEWEQRPRIKALLQLSQPGKLPLCIPCPITLISVGEMNVHLEAALAAALLQAAAELLPPGVDGWAFTRVEEEAFDLSSFPKKRFILANAREVVIFGLRCCIGFWNGLRV